MDCSGLLLPTSEGRLTSLRNGSSLALMIFDAQKVPSAVPKIPSVFVHDNHNASDFTIDLSREGEMPGRKHATAVEAMTRSPT